MTTRKTAAKTAARTPTRRRRSAAPSAKRKSKVQGRAAPWDREPPQDGRSHRLTPRQKAMARRRAKAAGRPYPNLVDNMNAARGAKK